MIASGGVLSVEYGHDGPGVCRSDGQMESEEKIPSQGGRDDALLRCMPPTPDLLTSWIVITSQSTVINIGDIHK